MLRWEFLIYIGRERVVVVDGYMNQSICLAVISDVVGRATL